MDDEKKMSRSDYEDYLTLALSSANHEVVSDAMRQQGEAPVTVEQPRDNEVPHLIFRGVLR